MDESILLLECSQAMFTFDQAAHWLVRDRVPIGPSSRVREAVTGRGGPSRRGRQRGWLPSRASAALPGPAAVARPDRDGAEAAAERLGGAGPRPAGVEIARDHERRRRECVAQLVAPHRAAHADSWSPRSAPGGPPPTQTPLRSEEPN